MKQESEALNLLQKLVELYPDNYKAEYFLGSVLEDEKKRKEAMESYKMIIGRK